MMGLKMVKLQFLFTVITLSQAAYYSRMAPQNRLRAPTAFRPGVSLQQRPWNHRLMQAASHRAPYVVYRNPPHRYAVKHYAPTTRNVFAGGPWKTTARLPGISPVTPEYEFLRAASSPPLVHTDGGTGAIHTIPAPNLSLSEKPIVVIDSSDSGHNAATEQVKGQGHHIQIRIMNKPKPTYEVSEKFTEPVYQMAKIEIPVGFTKAQPIQSSPDMQTYVRNGAALQIASDYGLSAISIPHNPIAPQQYSVQNLQGFSGFQPQQEVHSGADSIMIPPNVLFQSDPMFLQKLQHQLLQKFPALEFVPYAAELLPPNPQPNNFPPQPQQLFLLENEEIKQPPEPFLSSESKNVVQRETHEGSLVTLLPQGFTNATEKVEPSTPQPHNITFELISTEPQPLSTTIKYAIESNTESQNAQDTTPIYYAQIGQSVGNVIANGFYSAINDVRAAAAMEQVETTEQTQETTKSPETPTTTSSTIAQDLNQYFVQNKEPSENKTELKPLLGVPFGKPPGADSVKVAYTLLRTDEKEPKMTKEGTVYAGQIVEASISEDQDFNNQKATLVKRAPIRLYVTDKKDMTSPATSSAPKAAVVKAKIPPKSKLTFDDKTGEPVLRIYASYVDSPTQRKIVTSKLASMKPVTVTRKITMEPIESWKASTVKSEDKTQGFDGNQVSQFGLKLRSRSDNYIPLFEEYEE